MTEEEIKIIKEYKPCFGKYYNKDMNVCEEGNSGLCPYCVECQKECVYY